MHAYLLALSLWAENAPDAGPLGGSNLLLYAGVGFVLMWLIVLRPAQRKERERKEALTKVKKGDRVVVAGGIVGTVYSPEENVPGLAEPAIVIRVDDKSRLTVLRSSIFQVLAEPATEAKKEQTASTT